jgi:RNA polymerase-interacting CarD/CdnL/TRCF family regulator
MSFEVGETVVYPHHGAALIEAIETRLIKGEEKTYLVLKIAQGDLTVRVPAENVDLVGVRDVVDSAGLDRVFNVLRQPYTEEPTNWSRRYKANLEKLASGDVIIAAIWTEGYQLVKNECWQKPSRFWFQSLLWPSVLTRRRPELFWTRFLLPNFFYRR